MLLLLLASTRPTNNMQSAAAQTSLSACQITNVQIMCLTDNHMHTYTVNQTQVMFRHAPCNQSNLVLQAVVVVGVRGRYRCA